MALINCIPVFIASDLIWARKFERQNLPLIGDDVKSQLEGFEGTEERHLAWLRKRSKAP